MTTCQRCQAEIPEGHQVEVRGRGRQAQNALLCANCAAELEREMQAETENPNLILAALAGLGAAAIGALVWYGVVVITNYQVGIIAAGIGWLVGIAVVFGSGRKRGPALQAISVIITLMALAVSQYLIMRHFAVEYLTEQEPGFPGLPLLLPVGLMFELVVEGLKSDLLTIVFWGIALLAAVATPARRRLRRV